MRQLGKLTIHVRVIVPNCGPRMVQVLACDCIPESSAQNLSADFKAANPDGWFIARWQPDATVLFDDSEDRMLSAGPYAVVHGQEATKAKVRSAKNAVE